MNKKMMVIIGAVVFAAFGTLMLVRFVSSAEERAVAESGESRVVVALVSGDIPAGTSVADILEQGLVADADIPELAVVPGALTVSDLQARESQLTTIALTVNDQIFDSRLASELDEEAGDELPFVGRTRTIAAPPELLEVTVPVGSAASLGGELIPGELVAVIANFGELTLVNGGSATTINDEGEIVPLPESLEADDVIVPDRTGTIARHVLVTEVRAAGAQSQAAVATLGEPEEGSAEPTLAQSLVPLEGTVLVTLAADVATIERIVFAAANGEIWFANDPDTTPEGGNSVQSYDTVYSSTTPVGAEEQ